MADELQEAGLFHRGQYGGDNRGIGAGGNGAGADEGAASFGKRGTSVVRNGRCQVGVQQRARTGSVGLSGEVVKGGVVQ